MIQQSTDKYQSSVFFTPNSIKNDSVSVDVKQFRKAQQNKNQQNTPQNQAQTPPQNPPQNPKVDFGVYVGGSYPTIQKQKIEKIELTTQNQQQQENFSLEKIKKNFEVYKKPIQNERGVFVGYEDLINKKSVSAQPKQYFLEQNQPTPQNEVRIELLQKNAAGGSVVLISDKNIYYKPTNQNTNDKIKTYQADYYQSIITREEKPQNIEKLREQEFIKQATPTNKFYANLLSFNSPSWSLWQSKSWEEQEKDALKEYYRKIEKSDTYIKAFKTTLFETPPGVITTSFFSGVGMSYLPLKAQIAISTASLAYQTPTIIKTIKNYNSFDDITKKQITNSIFYSTISFAAGSFAGRSHLQNIIKKQVEQPTHYEQEFYTVKKSEGVSEGVYSSEYSYKILNKQYDLKTRTEFKTFDNELFGVGKTYVFENNKKISSFGSTLKMVGLGKKQVEMTIPTSDFNFEFDKKISVDQAVFDYEYKGFGGGGWSVGEVLGVKSYFRTQPDQVLFKTPSTDKYIYANTLKAVGKSNNKPIITAGSDEKIIVSTEKVSIGRGEGVVESKINDWSIIPKSGISTEQIKNSINSMSGSGGRVLLEKQTISDQLSVVVEQTSKEQVLSLVMKEQAKKTPTLAAGVVGLLGVQNQKTKQQTQAQNQAQNQDLVINQNVFKLIIQKPTIQTRQKQEQVTRQIMRQQELTRQTTKQEQTARQITEQVTQQVTRQITEQVTQQITKQNTSIKQQKTSMINTPTIPNTQLKNIVLTPPKPNAYFQKNILGQKKRVESKKYFEKLNKIGLLPIIIKKEKKGGVKRRFL